MQKEEFDYLVDLKENTIIRPDDVIKAVTYLLKKNAFKQITITYSPGICGVCVHIELEAFLLLGKIKIRGVFTGRQEFAQCYVIDRGDRFDHECHEHSTEKMKDICKQEGYFNAQIRTVFTYNDEAKIVNPTITIAKGPRFIVGSAEVLVYDDDGVIGEQKAVLQKKIYRTFIKHLLQKPYHKKHLNQCAVDIKEYLISKGLSAATITLDEHNDNVTRSVWLKWRIDIPYKCLFVFWGNHFFSDQQLRCSLQEFGTSSWLLPASLLVQEIERLYHDKGFRGVSIEVREEKDRYFFMIKEGLRTRIESVECVNAQAIKSDVLVKHCFADLLKASFFDKDILEDGLSRLRDLYASHGFLNARINGYEIIEHRDESNTLESTCAMRVSVDEGESTTCVGVEIPSWQHLVQQHPFVSIAKTKGGVVLSQELIAEQRSFLEQYLRDQGYRSARLDFELRGQDQGVVLVWHIECDKNPVRFGKTIVQGSCPYAFGLIMRELQYERGQLWHQEALKKTFLQFKKRAIFDIIHVQGDSTHSVREERPVILRLQQDDPCEVRLRCGLGFQNIQNYQSFSGLTYKLGGSFIVKNPAHCADLLSLRADFSRPHRECVMKYMVPWVFHFPFDGVVQLYSTRYEQPGFIGSRDTIYTITQHGLLGGIYKKTAYCDGGVHVGFEGMRTAVDNGSYNSDLAHAISFNPQLHGKMVPFFFIEPTMYIDYLDDKLNPRCGLYILTSAKGMVPLSNSFESGFFVKVMTECALFVPIARWVAALRFRIGHIFYQKFESIMPTERFYLGGSHSVRGYNADAAPPLGVFIDELGKEQLVARGGKTMINGNCELRIPLMARMGGVLFQDVGLLSASLPNDFTMRNVVAATGFGIRIYTPVGPLRFDIGFNWRRHHPAQSRFAWFLTFGHAF